MWGRTVWRVTIRASQSDIEKACTKFISFGWRVLSTSKGSEWGRVGASYKWTIILEIDDDKKNVDEIIENVLQEFSLKSYGKTALLCIGAIIGIFCLIVLSLLYFI